MYHVHEHRTTTGVHRWTNIWEGRRKAEAIAAADAAPMHATVTKAYTSDVIYDNSKRPGQVPGVRVYLVDLDAEKES